MPPKALQMHALAFWPGKARPGFCEFFVQLWAGSTGVQREPCCTKGTLSQPSGSYAGLRNATARYSGDSATTDALPLTAGGGRKYKRGCQRWLVAAVDSGRDRSGPLKRSR